MDEAEMRRRVARARVASLATVTVDRHPHVVPCCFAVVDDLVVSAVDAKPKTTTSLRRLANIRANPSASLLVDHYDDADWGQLWWVRVDGAAAVVDGGRERDVAIAALTAKYPQYAAASPPGSVVVLRDLRWRGWSAR